ncbi:pyruvate oxidase [Planococcus sp. CP5-4]|uniref:pyruvate oxidase n=1 Tax=unclassified Planococcus (in: firmicutes) TaxID=2662419 RepID=UPI001C2398FB|nr:MULTISPECIES: pyruvate oxidase [unclassified Planococcus (in: firmicutes)]MBU9673054.1 pyruvate oxidase [Planococcus sp. CP5-4_YE]MBV0908826.1 pyruvate oxidase [Planococcus sp. CP5-4_UN]MBW6063595.1 pyruvate oxidase [Planococcus sp. CP5-4]
MFERTAGSHVVELLKQWDVGHIYGMPGDSINELMEELRKEDIRFIQIRHEETGALAASAYSKLTGHIGVCLSIAGPGAIHLQNGLYDAKKDKTPVLAIVGQVTSSAVGTDTFQELKLESMFEDVSVYNRRVQNAEQLPDMLNQAVRAAYAEKGPAVLVVSDDLFSTKIKREQEMTSPEYSVPHIRAAEEDLQEALKLLKSAKKPVILAGKGAQNASGEVLAFSEKLKAPVIASLPAKGLIPDDHPNNLGQLGQLGTEPSEQAMKQADLVILAGTAYPYREYLPDKAPAIQIDLEPRVIGKYYPATVGVVGELGPALAWLTSKLGEKDAGFLNQFQEKRRDWHDKLHADIDKQTDMLQPQQVLGEMQHIMEQDAVVSLDVGSITIWTAKYLQLSGQKLVLSSWLGTMGCGLPGAIAAKLAYPERQVVAIVGDGGFSMGMQDFVTAVKYDLPMIIVVFNNQKLQLIEDEQKMAGNKPTNVELANIDFAAFAIACGGEGYTVKTRAELQDALSKAKTSKQPVVIDAYVDDNSSVL